MIFPDFHHKLNIVEMDGDRYVMVVPPGSLLRQAALTAPGAILPSYIPEKMVIENDFPSHDRVTDSFSRRICLYLPEKQKNEVLWFEEAWADPVHCSSEMVQVAFRPLLIPLGPDGKRSFELSSTPDGTELEGGCLYDVCSHVLEDSFWTKMPFLPGMCLPRAYSPENPRQVYDQTIFLGDTHPGIPPLK